MELEVGSSNVHWCNLSCIVKQTFPIKPNGLNNRVTLTIRPNFNYYFLNDTEPFGSCDMKLSKRILYHSDFK